MKISVHQERSINYFNYIVCIIFVAGIWTGCSSPKETIEDESVTEMGSNTQDSSSVVVPVQPPSGKNQMREKSSTQRFTVQADTVDVQRKKKQSSVASSISVKAAAPKKFYTVEIGAFKLQSNVKRHQEQLASRFKLPVRVLFDSSITLTRVCVGTFSTKTLASKFMEKMQKQFPKDYPDCWVSYWTK